MRDFAPVNIRIDAAFGKARRRKRPEGPGGRPSVGVPAFAGLRREEPIQPRPGGERVGRRAPLRVAAKRAGETENQLPPGSTAMMAADGRDVSRAGGAGSVLC